MRLDLCVLDLRANSLLSPQAKAFDALLTMPTLLVPLRDFDEEGVVIVPALFAESGLPIAHTLVDHVRVFPLFTLQALLTSQSLRIRFVNDNTICPNVVVKCCSLCRSRVRPPSKVSDVSRTNIRAVL